MVSFGACVVPEEFVEDGFAVALAVGLYVELVDGLVEREPPPEDRAMIIATTMAIPTNIRQPVFDELLCE